MALMSDEKACGLYIRVELPRVLEKYTVQFDLIQYVDHPLQWKRLRLAER